MTVPVSVCLITCNEELKIRRALESAKWADEIIVVDSGSTDKTLDICKNYTSRIYHQDWLGYINQKNHALQYTTHDWVLAIDSDEEISSELIQEIQTILGNDPKDIDGFEFPRKSYYMGRWILHSGWYPDSQLRLFRKSKAKWGGIDPHDRIQLNGQKKKLSGHLLHYGFSSIHEHLKTIDRYSTIWVEQNHAKKSPSLLRWFIKPIVKIIECYFIKRGFLDGVPGLVIACLSAYYIQIREIKLYEYFRSVKKKDL